MNRAVWHYTMTLLISCLSAWILREYLGTFWGKGKADWLSKVRWLLFGSWQTSSLCNFYQMGQKMKNLKQVTFKGEVVPNDLEINPKFEDLVNLCNIGYERPHIWVGYSQKVIFDIPSKNKKAYRVFIDRICSTLSPVFN